MADLQQCLVKHWVHSHEEDTSEVSVYRPVHYRFPPSRGRRGFDFHENGEVIYYGIGRADGVEQLSGRWVLEGANRIMLQVDSARIQPFVLEVVSCDDQTLKVKKS